MKLSRILSNQNGTSRQQANRLIATGRVTLDGVICRRPAEEVSRFQWVQVDNETIQAGACARYLMLNKPPGYLSATLDDQHPTVVDLIAAEHRAGIHIAGRLDRASTGLILLTNDGLWSRRLTEPAVKIPKIYRVTTALPISAETGSQFARGIWFAYEQLTTLPAELDQFGPREARITLYEGRYHQVKRMFAAVGNRVTSLHREQIGGIALPENLAQGAWRDLTPAELRSGLT